MAIFQTLSVQITLFAKFNLVESVSDQVTSSPPSIPLDIWKTRKSFQNWWLCETNSQKTEHRKLTIWEGVKWQLEDFSVFLLRPEELNRTGHLIRLLQSAPGEISNSANWNPGSLNNVLKGICYCRLLWTSTSKNVLSWHVRSAKIQIRLRICAVWSESSLSAFWIAKYAMILHTDVIVLFQIARMHRLEWALDGRTFQKMRFLCLRLLLYWNNIQICFSHQTTLGGGTPIMGGIQSLKFNLLHS